MDLDSVALLNSARGRTSTVASSEIAAYNAEIARIEEETRESERTLAELKEELARAQRSRKDKIVYDGVAKEALKLPSRAHSADNIARLTSELQTLEAERQRYAETWASRQDAFSAIVRSLEELGERVREEKTEQERREALGDDDEEEADVAGQEKGGNGGSKSGNATGGEESGAEDGSAKEDGKANQRSASTGKLLDPMAKAFEPVPSPLRQGESAGVAQVSEAGLGAPGMAVDGDPEADADEDGEVVMQLLDDESRRKRAAQIAKEGRDGSRREREEGEEEEEDAGEDSTMQDA